jgi:hypothetical protein
MRLLVVLFACADAPAPSGDAGDDRAMDAAEGGETGRLED